MRDRFSTEEACRSYLAELRWPDGIICPACGSKGIWIKKPPPNRCASCKHDFSVTSGTLFADTHKPLRLWFEAVWWDCGAAERPAPKHPELDLGDGRILVLDGDELPADELPLFSLN